MKIEELRVGNLVWGVSDRLETVVGILDNKVYTKLPGLKTEPFQNNIEDISPVILNENYLLTNGGKKDGFNNINFPIHKFTTLVVSLDQGYIYLGQGSRKDIVTLRNRNYGKEFYIHDFQNLIEILKYNYAR